MKTENDDTRRLVDMTDEQLSDAIREQVNKSRYTTGGHDRQYTRNLANEANRRGWNLGVSYTTPPEATRTN